MKGKRRLSERLTAFLIAFAMTAGMVMEPVSVSALPEELVGAQSMAQASAEDSQQTPPETQEPPIDAGDSGDVIPPAPSVTKIVVNGQVLCGETAVEGARISIGESIVTTNTEGVFSCEVGANQNYEVVIEKEGFERKVVSLTAGEENINLVGIQINLFSIYASIDPTNTETVSTTSSTTAVFRNPLSMFAFSKAILKFSKLPNVAGKSNGEVAAYSSFVLNAVNIHTLTGTSAITDARINDIYLITLNIIAAGFIFLNFII